MKTQHYFKVLFLVLTLNSFAQLDKKTWLVGGNLSFDSYKRENTNYYGSYSNPNIVIDKYKINTFNITSKFGYFIIDKLALGVTPSYIHTESRQNDSSISKFNSLVIGPFVRYYFLKKDKPYNVFTDASCQMGYVSYPSVDMPLKSPITKYSAMAGVEFFFNSSAGVELLAGYNFQKQNGDRTSNGGFISQYEEKGFKIAIGFQLHLQKD